MAALSGTGRNPWVRNINFDTVPYNLPCCNTPVTAARVPLQGAERTTGGGRAGIGDIGRGGRKIRIFEGEAGEKRPKLVSRKGVRQRAPTVRVRERAAIQEGRGGRAGSQRCAGPCRSRARGGVPELQADLRARPTIGHAAALCLALFRIVGMSLTSSDTPRSRACSQIGTAKRAGK